MQEITLPDVLTFDWDKGNSIKSWIKHRVTAREQEQAFFNKERIILEDKKHSQWKNDFCCTVKLKRKGSLLLLSLYE